MNTNKKLQINLLHSLVIFSLVTGFCFNCEKYGIRSRGTTEDISQSFFSGLSIIQDCLPGLYEGGKILWNSIASVAKKGGDILWNIIAFAANEGGETIALAALKGGEIMWNTIASDANEGGEILREISLEETDDCGDVEAESFFSVPGSDGETETTFDDAHDKVSESDAFWRGASIYIDTINVYNYCEY